MDFSDQQNQALKAVRDWLVGDNDRQVFRLFGYAGTGKTTLAKYFAQDFPGTLFGAFTGKAALVLRQKGCVGASTIHSLIYTPCDKSRLALVGLQFDLEKLAGATPPDPTAIKALRERIREEEKRLKQPSFNKADFSPVEQAPLVVIDEVSMVGTKLAEDLLSYGTKTLVLGDPAQLPPVADGGYFTNSAPDFMLDEVHRQAAGSPIITLATHVRGGGRVSLGEYGDSRVIMRGMMSPVEIAAKHSIILCGKNATRRSINRVVRDKVHGRTGPLPQVDDRLVCLKNNSELGLLNGSLWTVVFTSFIDDTMVSLELVGDDGTEVATCAHTAPFLGQEVDFRRRRDADEFDFGYCLTTHKAQGSQWPSVYVVDESEVFRDDRSKWLYTAITRAADRVTVAV